MKTSTITKGTMALIIGLGASACSHDVSFDQQTAQKKAYEQSFYELLGQKIDPLQTWNASIATSINVTAPTKGTVKVYTTSPLNNPSAPLVTQHISAGEKLSLTVARPQDVTRLYVSFLDADGFIEERDINITEESSVNFTHTISAAKGRLRSISRLPSAADFPDAPESSAYATTLPDDHKSWKETAGNTGGWSSATGNYLLDYNQVDAQGEQSKLYVQGDFAPTSFYMGANMKLYILPGATLTLPSESFSFSQAGGEIYVASGATLKVNGKLQIGNQNKLYSAGTVSVDELDVCGSGLLYNQGKLSVSDKSYLSNDESVLVNAGIFTTASFETQGSSHFLNTEDGDATISGQTYTSSVKNYWVNDGVYTTATFPYVAGSNNIINNCRLNITDTWKIETGDGTFYNSGSIVAQNLYMGGPSHITLSANAMILVKGTASFGCSLDGYGISSIATGSDYAVFKAKKVVKLHDNQRREVTYSGNLIVDAEEHFAQGEDGSGHPQGSYYLLENGAKMTSTEASIAYTIPASKCSPGYSHEVSNNEEPVMKYFYAFEDLGATGDFDFNDVVLAVSAPVDGKSDIYLMAAGGTLETIVKLDGEQVGSEVHESFGVSTTTMVNTTSVNKSFVKIGEATGVSDPSALPLSILVESKLGSREVSGPAVGEVPLMIRVPGNASGKWFWPVERTSIIRPYNGFGEWGASYQSNTDWYLNPGGGAVSY